MQGLHIFVVNKRYAKVLISSIMKVFGNDLNILYPQGTVWGYQ